MTRGRECRIVKCMKQTVIVYFKQLFGRRKKMKEFVMVLECILFIIPLFCSLSYSHRTLGKDLNLYSED